MQLLITNPPKKRRRKAATTKTTSARRRRVRAQLTKEAQPMAKRRRRSRSRSAFSNVPARRTTRRRGAFSRISEGFSVGAAVRQGAAAGIGAIATVGLLGMVSNSIPDALKATPTARALTKAAVGIGLGFAAKKVGQGKYAVAIAAGAIASSLLDFYAAWKANQSASASGVRGLNYFGANTDGVAGLGELPAFDANGNPIAWIPAEQYA